MIILENSYYIRIFPKYQMWSHSWSHRACQNALIPSALARLPFCTFILDPFPIALPMPLHFSLPDQTVCVNSLLWFYFLKQSPYPNSSYLLLKVTSILQNLAPLLLPAVAFFSHFIKWNCLDMFSSWFILAALSIFWTNSLCISPS